MAVRAKFTVSSVADTRYSKDHSVHVVKLTPVYGGSEENDKFFSSTPCGSIELQTVSPEAAKQFEPGKEYYIDFTLAE